MAYGRNRKETQFFTVSLIGAKLRNYVGKINCYAASPFENLVARSFLLMLYRKAGDRHCNYQTTLPEPFRIQLMLLLQIRPLNEVQSYIQKFCSIDKKFLKG